MIPNIYKIHYKQLIIFPIILILASVGLIIFKGIPLGVDFRGGTLITISGVSSLDVQGLKSSFSEMGVDAKIKVVDSGDSKRVEIEIPQTDKRIKMESLKKQFDSLLPKVSSLEVDVISGKVPKTEYDAALSKLEGIASEMASISGSQMPNYETLSDLESAFSSLYESAQKSEEEAFVSIISKHSSFSSISVNTISPKLSERFLSSAFSVAAYSAVLTVVLVFLFFRSVVPSAAVLMGALSDIILALGGLALFEIPLTLASFSALLMLVGYSLDTDILLTMRMLKRKGDPREKAYDAMKTGVTMSTTAILSFLVLFVVSLMTNIPIYYQISSVALVGLVGDLFATWGINAVMLLWHLEGNKR